MSNTLRIAHCSDIHLDGDVLHPDHYRDGFARVLSAMRDEQPQLMLVAGDLFDANSATDDTIRWAMNQLAEQPCPVVMIPGNHDCLLDDAIFRRYDFDALPNVEMLLAPNGELRELTGLATAVWGKGMLDHTPEHQPLANCPARPDGVTWYLGLGHGMYIPEGTYSDRSSPIHEREIGESPCDYLALGHHHAALEVHNGDTFAAYCGSPTDTVGAGATYAVIDLAVGRAPMFAIRVLDEGR
jgi:DNA repair protein SbcD/Mre11